jgi:C1A family cysteine protease
MEYLEREGAHTLECNPYISQDGKSPNTCMIDDYCEAGEPIHYKCEQDSTIVMESPEAIKQEILKNGPVTTFFLAFTDLLYYKSGVYHKTGGEFGGGHAVKIVGWGRT